MAPSTPEALMVTMPAGLGWEDWIGSGSARLASRK